MLKAERRDAAPSHLRDGSVRKFQKLTIVARTDVRADFPCNFSATLSSEPRVFANFA